MDVNAFKERANELGSKGRPFFFLLDFELKKPFICPVERAAEYGFFYNIKGRTNSDMPAQAKKIKLNPQPISESHYASAFSLVKQHLKAGNTYLLNLTFPTRLEGNLSLESIFSKSNAPYTLLHKDDFVLFSPECFVRIADDRIYSYPMKGTIDASIPGAADIILQNNKERWEHNTIVDLIRNDLSMVSENVEVARFRFIDHLKTSNRELLQVSSEIRGDLGTNWQGQIGDILLKLLPAGSISGAPKARTVEIIKDAEGEYRGYFTGIFGIFNRDSLDSAVNIRFIEKTHEGFRFRSGGGITAQSIMAEEYSEMINKVYVPFA